MIQCPLKAAVSAKPAWIDRDLVWSFQELDELADRWVADLSDRGVAAGSRVAVFHPPCASLASLFFAAWRLKASICPLNLRLPQSGIDRILKRLQPDLLITELKVGLKKIAIDTLDPHLPALLAVTSGSTAEPKIGALSVGNLLANAKGALDLIDLQEGDRWLLNLPLFHVGGIGILMRCILAKAAVSNVPNDLEITHISCVPTQLYRATPVYRKLKALLLGGAPIHSYPKHLPVIATYGLTEMGSMVLAKKHPPNGYLGFPLPGREVKLADDGEILVRGECLFLGYLQNGTLLKPNGWFGTRDLGRFDTAEGIEIVGRKDWQFISGGENIQPEEIEKYLMELPGIQEAAVLPLADPEYGARPVAFIVGKIGFDQMKQELLKSLPKYKIPIQLFSLEEMPKIGLKIDRGQLFDLLNNKKF